MKAFCSDGEIKRFYSFFMLSDKTQENILCAFASIPGCVPHVKLWGYAMFVKTAHAHTEHLI